MFLFLLMIYEDFKSYKHNSPQMKDDNLSFLIMQITIHQILNTKRKCKIESLNGVLGYAGMTHVNMGTVLCHTMAA